MDTAWIEVFVLTLSECVAPAGKTVCEQQEVRMQFVEQAECELALQQFLELKGAADNVIVYKDKSHCAPSARQRPVYKSLNEVNQKLAGSPNWTAPVIAEPPVDFIQSSHLDRLASLHDCEDVSGVAPCKVGDIIVESVSQRPVEVWRREN